MVVEARIELDAIGGQYDFVVSSAYAPGLFAGRGYGKSFGFLVKMFNKVEKNPGIDGLITAPTNHQLNNVLIRQAKRSVYGQSYGENRDWFYLEKKQEIVFPRLGSSIFCRPASEPDNIRGHDVGFGGMDEIASGDDQYPAFVNLTLSVRQPGYDPQVWVTGTPSDVRPWIRDLWRDGIWPESGEPLDNPEDFPVFRGATEQNLNLPEQVRIRYVKQWGNSRLARQELFGEFLSIHGLVFDNFSPAIHIADPPMDMEFKRKRGGLDFGVSSPTALHVLKEDFNKELWVTAEFYKRNALPEQWMEWAKEQGLTKIVCDPSIAERDRLYLNQRFAPITLIRAPSRRFKDRYDFWASRLAIKMDGNPGIHISPSCPNLIDEIPNMALDKRKGYETSLERWATGVSDHGYDSTAYAGMTFDRLTETPQVEISYEGWDY